MPLPPWLDITPQSYMQAVQAGDQAGQAIARERNRVDETVFKNWLLEQQMRNEAQRELAKQQHEETALQALQDYRMREAAVREAQGKVAEQRAAEYERHNQAVETGLQDYRTKQQDRDRVFFGAGGQMVRYNPDGTVTELRPGTPQESKVSPETTTTIKLLEDRIADKRAMIRTGKLDEDKTNRLQLEIEELTWAIKDQYHPYSAPPGNPAGATPGLPSAAAPQSAPSPEPVRTSANEIIRLAKNGRRAVFDSITKQFLRYADGEQPIPDNAFHF